MTTMSDCPTRRHVASHRALIDDAFDRASSEVVIVVDDELRLLSVSEHGAALSHIFDMEFEDMAGRSILDAIHPDDLALTADRVALVHAGLDTGGTELRLGPAGGPYHHVFHELLLMESAHSFVAPMYSMGASNQT